MKRLHVNLGYPKCGSSAVQTFLRKNEQSLNDQGVAYPLFDKRELRVIERKGFCSGNGAFIAHALRFDGDYDRMFELISTAPEPDVIIATETFGNVSDDQIKPFLDWVQNGSFTTKFYAWTRDPFDLILSGWNQTVKAGRGLNTLEQACARYTDLHKRINLLFSKNHNIIERNFNEDKHDIINGFLKAAVPHVVIDTSHHKIINRSLSWEECLVVLQLNKSAIDDDLRNEVVNRLMNHEPIGQRVAHNNDTVRILCDRLGLSFEVHSHKVKISNDGPSMKYLREVKDKINAVLADLESTLKIN